MNAPGKIQPHIRWRTHVALDNGGAECLRVLLSLVPISPFVDLLVCRGKTFNNVNVVSYPAFILSSALINKKFYVHHMCTDLFYRREYRMTWKMDGIGSCLFKRNVT